MFHISSDHAIRRFLLRGSIGSFVLQGSLTLITLLSSILVARLGGDAGLGVYTIVFTWIQALAIPAVAGSDDLLVRELAAQEGRGEQHLWRNTLQWVVYRVGIVSISITGVFLLLVNFTNFMSLHRYSLYFNLAAASIPLFAIMHTAQAALRGFHLVNAGQIAEKFVKPMVVFLVLAALWFLNSRVTNGYMIMANTLSYAAAGGVAAIMLWVHYRKIPLSPAGADLPTAQWTRLAFYFCFLATLQVFTQRLDILLLSGFMPDEPEKAGHYNVALKFADFLFIPLTLSNTIAAPLFARLHAAGDKQELLSVFRRISLIQWLVTLAMTIGLLLIGQWLITTLYGPAFSASYPVLIILCVAQLIYAAFGPLGYMLMMTGHERQVAVAQVIGVIIALTVHLILIPLWGIEGAAWGVIAGYIGYNVPLWIYFRSTQS